MKVDDNKIYNKERKKYMAQKYGSNTDKNVQTTPAVQDRFTVNVFGWITMRSTSRLGFSPLPTLNGTYYMLVATPGRTYSQGFKSAKKEKSIRFCI